MRPILNKKPKRDAAKVAEILMKKGTKPEEAEPIIARARMSDRLMKIYDTVDAFEIPYLTPNAIPSDIIIHKGASPKFFQQTSEQELVKGCDLPTYYIKSHSGDGTMPPGNFDSVYGLLLDFKELFAKVGVGLKGTLADRLGLQYLRDRKGEYPMMAEYAHCGERNRQYQWYTPAIYEYRDASNIVVTSIHQVKEDGTEKYILQSELMALLRLMVMKSRRPEAVSHQIFPVLLISFRPYQIVIIEAYEDGKHFHVNYGEPIVMSEQVPPKEQDKRMKSVLGWAAARPCGKTASYSDCPP
ncbi:hypothetical protein McanMca71_002817 [Microsporum canis]|uniref:Uncharacterized protein n=1 Tax=Arthroderma otae (strain ATCC MYA-4605 / CBS 113480) TaxID=554155 RepID=C5FVR1_ARTOC|nr:uncharacterized protein MCYG_06814 [Microsporum canis CBS 113480]EEQ33995.1 predicted protein [Microsporum canis CBS 113480]